MTISRKRVSGADESEQHERFIEAAREAGCDESEEAFERAVRKVGERKESESTAPKRSSHERDRRKAR